MIMNVSFQASFSNVNKQMKSQEKQNKIAKSRPRPDKELDYHDIFVNIGESKEERRYSGGRVWSVIQNIEVTCEQSIRS